MPIVIMLLFVASLAKAQIESPDLVTDRPDQTESSAIVPLKSLQIETGFVVEHKEHDGIKEHHFAFNSTLLRYGLLENLELRLGLEYLGEKSTNTGTNISHTITGLSPLYTGFKLKISDERGWKPDIAFLAGLILPFTAKKEFKPNFTAVDFRFAFSHTLSQWFSIGYNLGAVWDGQTAVPSYFYSVALGAALVEKLGMFVEGYGLIAENGEAKHLLDVGFTYLLLPNFQLDASGGIGLQNSIDNFLSAGITFRLPH